MPNVGRPRNLGNQVFRMNRANKDGSPKKGWWEVGDCRKVDCSHYLLGWVTDVDTKTKLGQRQSYYIRTHSDRSFKEVEIAGGLVRFAFEPGQKCFNTHTIPVDRDPIFSNRAPGWEARTMDYDEFHEEFNETVIQIEQSKRGI